MQRARAGAKRADNHAIQPSAPSAGVNGFSAGYLMAGNDGGVFDFSDKAFVGSLGARPPPVSVVAVSPLG